MTVDTQHYIDSHTGLTRRQFIRDGVGLTVLMVTGGLLTGSKPEESRIQISVERILDLIPPIKGWAKDDCLQTGTFCLNWSSLNGRNGRQETVLEVANPQLIESEDYDRFPAVQLVRASKLSALIFFQRLNTAYVQAGKPEVVTKEQWEKILGIVSPEAVARWQQMDKLPKVSLPKSQGLQFNWYVDKLPQDFLDIREDENRLVYWIAPVQGTLPWPLDQGDLEDRQWLSRRVVPHTYEHAFWVKTTSFNKNGPSEVGPEGSLPYIGLNPWFYSPAGQWVNP